MKYSREEILQYVAEEDVKFIRLAFCDVRGRQKNISVMPGELERALDGGIAIDASAIAGFGGEVRSDLLLRPDPATLAPLPWRPEHGRVVRLFCTLENPDGSPCKADTRALLAQAVADAFRYGKLVLATTTYNADVFPFMRTFIEHLTERNYQNRTVALIENGSWAPLAAKVMKGMFEKSKNITFVGTPVTIRSALSAENREQLGELAKELCREYAARDSEMADKHDMSALFRIGYGLYVVTSNDGKRDNGLIVNTVTQVSDNPNRIAVNINKANYSHHVIKQTGILNVNCLSVDAPFKVFETFGFQSGRAADKFAGMAPIRSDNGLAILPKYINAAFSLKVEQYVDLGTHGMFICSVTEARVMSDRETMTYTYYQNNVKPKPETEGKHGFVCKVCGWIYEGDTLPDDIVCPLCKHGAADFEPIG